MKYLTVQEVTCKDPAAFGVRLDPLMEALLRLEAADSAIEDPDLAADLGTGCVDVQMTVEAADLALARYRGGVAQRDQFQQEFGARQPGAAPRPSGSRAAV